MTSRRDALFGGACGLALLGAEILRPRRALNLLAHRNLDGLVPRGFGSWSSSPGGDFVLPQSGNSLAARLYAEQLMRIYWSEDQGSAVMLLVAYGGSQTDSLQLHRPESCYPAVGLPIKYHELVSIAVTRTVNIPGVILTAQSGQRTEDIAYWTRVGEYLPRTASDQRRDRLLMSLNGYIGDGLIVRASVLRTDPLPKFALLTKFLADLVLATAPNARDALIGSSLARDLGAS